MRHIKEMLWGGAFVVALGWAIPAVMAADVRPTDLASFHRVSEADGGATVIEPQAIFTTEAVVGIDVFPGRLTSQIRLSITPAAVASLAGATAMDGRIAIRPTTGAPIVVRFVSDHEGVMLVDLSTKTTRDLAATLRAVSPLTSQAAIMLSPTNIGSDGVVHVRAGQVVDVDLLLIGARNLRGYQVVLAATGGSAGSMTLTDVEMVTHRSDFVFSGLNSVEAANPTEIRVIAALHSGGVDVEGQAYLGNYRFQVSDDASGIFRLAVQADKSLLRDADSQPIAWRAAPAIKIVVDAQGKK